MLMCFILFMYMFLSEEPTFFLNLTISVHFEVILGFQLHDYIIKVSLQINFLVAFKKKISANWFRFLKWRPIYNGKTYRIYIDCYLIQ